MLRAPQHLERQEQGLVRELAGVRRVQGEEEGALDGDGHAVAAAHAQGGALRRARLGVDGDVRAAGEAVCGTTFDLGELRLDCAFFAWRMEGREGVGRYDLLRRR